MSITRRVAAGFALVLWASCPTVAGVDAMSGAGGPNPSSCAQPLFPNAQYDAGDVPSSVAIGDLDGVNGPDLAVANSASDDISVLLNQGDGTFDAAVAYDAGGSQGSVAIGDLDGVNGPDLAVASGYEGVVSVLLNQGDGTFAAAVAYDAGGSPWSVAIGDLDGVNGPDLSATNSVSNDIWVLLNQGDGTFTPAVAYSTDSLGPSVCVAIGDIDGINGPDLAVATERHDDPPWHFPGGVSVLLNEGDGTFAAAVWVFGGYSPWSVAIGDLDGVNGSDLAVADTGVSVLLNQGDGTFAAAVWYDAGESPWSVAIGDLDGVNGPDLAATNSASNDISVLLNQGDGTFAPAVAYSTGSLWPSVSVAIGDLDGVNGPDLAVANASSDDVSVLLNTCCPSDLDGSGSTDAVDLMIVLGAWGTPDGDVTGDGATDWDDLLATLAAWGPCSE